MRWLGLPLVDGLYWAKERRVCQVVRVRLTDGRAAVVANFHATGSRDKRIPDAEVLRAATFADGFAAPDEICILAGDFNVTAERSTTLSELTGPEWGSQLPGPGSTMCSSAARRRLSRFAGRSPGGRWTASS